LLAIVRQHHRGRLQCLDLDIHSGADQHAERTIPDGALVEQLAPRRRSELSPPLFPAGIENQDAFSLG
jgi:hypothetical protein